MQMKLHGQNLESLYKDVPMRLLPVEYLPDDYKGPNGGTEKEMIGEKTNIVYRYHFASHYTHVMHIAWSVGSGLHQDTFHHSIFHSF